MDDNLERIEKISTFVKKFYSALKKFCDDPNVKNGDLVNLEVKLNLNEAKIIRPHTLSLLTKVLNVYFVGTNYDENSITYEFLVLIEKENNKTK